MDPPHPMESMAQKMHRTGAPLTAGGPMSLGWSIVTVVAIIVLPFVAAWLTLAELKAGEQKEG
jgi:hypothetical protein